MSRAEIDEAEEQLWDVTVADGLEDNPMTVRAKFICSSVRKFRAGTWRRETNDTVYGFNYEADFLAVTGDASEENKSFFAATPNGSIKLSTVKEDLFEPGKSYYIDFTEADA